MTETQRVFTPTFRMHYAADVSHMVGEVVGPNTMGEFFRAVSVESDGESSTVTFELVRAS